MNVILSLYPNARGIGYICLELPGSVYDFGMIGTKPISNARLLERVKKFIKIMRPAVVVVRDNARSGKGKRIAELVGQIVEFAKGREIETFSYTREQMKDVFEIFGAKTKQDIAEWIGGFFPDLANKVPKRKKFYEDEDPNMGIFDALALALTHDYLSK